MLANKRKSYL